MDSRAAIDWLLARSSPVKLTFASSLAAQQNAPRGTKLQRSDRNFIVKAAKGGGEEVELGRLAQAKASSDAVKKFGPRMVEDHGGANKELMCLAANKGVKYTPALKGPDVLSLARTTSL
jgi:putative membrane protein